MRVGDVLGDVSIQALGIALGMDPGVKEDFVHIDAQTGRATSKKAHSGDSGADFGLVAMTATKKTRATMRLTHQNESVPW